MAENLAHYDISTDWTTDLLEDSMQAVENLMLEIVSSEVSVLRDASYHILQAGGKRIRPRLILLSYAATGGTDFDHVVPVAAAVELVHTASVVHDDINDHGVVRRGRPSINAVWGRTFALLTGDYLFTKVYELMAPYKDLNIILADATVALVEGETLQASAVKEGNLSRDVYFKIIALKTAALFKAASCLGAKLAGAPEADVKALGEYGYNIGLAFQIVDDILDLTADATKLGKTAGVDVAQGKGLAVAYAKNNPANGIAVADTVDGKTGDVFDSIKRKLLEGNTVAEGRKQAWQIAQLAINHLSALPDSRGKEVLVKLARQIIERDH